MKGEVTLSLHRGKISAGTLVSSGFRPLYTCFARHSLRSTWGLKATTSASISSYGLSVMNVHYIQNQNILTRMHSLALKCGCWEIRIRNRRASTDLAATLLDEIGKVPSFCRVVSLGINMQKNSNYHISLL